MSKSHRDQRYVPSEDIIRCIWIVGEGDLTPLTAVSVIEMSRQSISIEFSPGEHGDEPRDPSPNSG